MDFKQVYLYNGTPYLSFRGEDGEYQYPDDEWTDIPPTDGIYSPFYFDGNEWKGSTREEWLTTFPEEELYLPSNLEIDMAQTQMKLFTTQIELEQIRKDNAAMMKEIFKTREGIK
ncbi:hypothetical protein [Staphylococcus equorum]|uniref:Uncharacterized protein n=1 Tax=Staphylococcus equorum TaxID=246432 RepID=A0A9X4LCN2_9STAP|nr:hypothetical protein [Staphylococcus equorum]MDG0860334.1 hypothetical protein [Staphylococcus equorum]